MLSILLIIFTFSLTVFVHELGHFIMARRAGVRVYTFSIGIGPRLFTIYRDKKQTDWIISLFPIGGYVRMMGQNDTGEVSEEEKNSEESYLNKKPLQKLSIIVAGVVMNAIFAYLLVVVAFSIGVPFTDNTIGGIRPGSIASKYEFEVNDKIIYVNEKLVETWEDVHVMTALSAGSEEITYLVQRNGNTKKIIIHPLEHIDKNKKSIYFDIGIQPKHTIQIAKKNNKEKLSQSGFKSEDIILSLQVGNQIFKTPFSIENSIRNNPNKISTIIFSNQNGIISTNKIVIKGKATYSEGFDTLAIVNPIEGEPAYLSGIKQGDIITDINGESIKGWNHLYQKLLATIDTNAIEVRVNRSNENLKFKVIPKYIPYYERFVIGIEPFANDNFIKKVSYVEPWMSNQIKGVKIGDIIHQVKFKENYNKTFLTVQFSRNGNKDQLRVLLPPESQKTIGTLSVNFSSLEKMIRYPVYQSVYKSFSRVYREFQEIYLSFLNLVTGNISLKALSGPIRIFQVSYLVAEHKGLAYFLMLFAKIGFSLAFINILPFPVLDGGHAVMILYEMVMRKPLPIKFVNFLHFLGMVFLLAIFVFVMYNDIVGVFF